MKLSQVLLRKRKMNTKPQSFVRNWQWNNAWFQQQARKVKNIGMKESLVARGIPVYQPEELLSPLYPRSNIGKVDLVETVLNPGPRDPTHPLWQDTPAFTYSDRTWMPKGMEMEFALAATNSLSVGHLPERINIKTANTQLSLSTELRLETLIKSAFIGDAVQVKLPKNFKVPYIGWHPVESKMRPRNQYDYEKFSWGRNMPREYGVKNSRKLSNLTRGLFTEMVKSEPKTAGTLQCSTEKEVHRQFIQAPGGELIRYYLTVPLTVKSNELLEQVANPEEVEDTKNSPIVSVSPQSPLSTLHTTNIYRHENNHPVTSLQHSYPFINTVFDFQTSHVGDPFTDPMTWITPKQRSRCLMSGFAVAIGQARLRYGAQIEGDLPRPVTVNIVSTNGVKWEMTTLQLNSLDLGSEVKNIFFHHPEPLTLFDYCGYKEAQPTLVGVRPETFSLLQALITAH